MKARRRTSPAVVLGTLLVLFSVLAAAPAYAQRNPDCLLCHEHSQQFEVGPVDRETACPACHTPGLLGTHPFHQPGSNCGAYCHPGWGESLLSAVPRFLSPAGSFASPTSPNSDASVLHIIHSSQRWAAEKDCSTSACSSCHCAAACTACHLGGVSVRHDAHAETTRVPVERKVSYGILGEDQCVKSATLEQDACASGGCHDIASIQDSRPIIKEDFSHPAYPEYGYPEANTVTKTGTWFTMRGTAFTGGQSSLSNKAGATLSVPFTGEKVELISDLDPYRGRAEVWLDGSLVATLDGYASTTAYQRTIWSSDKLAPGPHVIQVRVRGERQAASRGTWFAVDGFRVYSTISEFIAPSCDESCHPDKTSSHGGSFTHEASQTVGTYPVGRFACTECHSLSMWTEHERSSSKTNADRCAACHTTYADWVMDEYVNTGLAGWGSCTWVGDGTVAGCHQVANSQEPHNYVDSDHDAAGVAGTGECRSCHGDDLSVIHDDSNAGRSQHASLVSNGYATDCLTCHGAAVYPATKSCSDAGCHVSSGVVSMATHPAPAHIGTNSNPGVPRTGGESCSECHLLELTSEHGKTSSLTDPGAQAIGCSGCHSAGYFPSGWLDTPGSSNTCNACHDPSGATDAGAPHEAADYAAKHDWSATMDASCGGADCHDTDAIDFIHTDPWNSTVTTPRGSSCESCHDSPNAVPTASSCYDCHSDHDTSASHDPNGSPGLAAANAGCLSCHTDFDEVDGLVHHDGSCTTCHNHLVTNRLDQYLQDNYEARCSDCHGDGGHTHELDVAGSDYVDAGATGCTNSGPGCHGSDADADYQVYHPTSGCLAGACHTSASQSDPQFDDPNTCQNCHDGSYLGALDTVGLCEDAPAGHYPVGIHTATGGLGTVDAGGATSAACADCHELGLRNAHAGTQFLSTTMGTRVTCVECHTAASIEVKVSNWTNDRCDDCHDGGVAGSAHGTSAPAVAAVSSAGCAASGAGCHDSSDLHVLHADASSCGLAGCHDVLDKDMGSSARTCGAAAGCHTSASYAPADHNGHDGDDAPTHASTGESARSIGGYTQSTACSGCHTLTLETAHGDAGFASPGCLDCHNAESPIDAVAVIKVAGWSTKRCDACHATSHDRYTAAEHAASAGSGCTIGGCHGAVAGMVDVRDLHDKATSGCSASGTDTYGWSGACHDLDTSMVPDPMSCGTGATGLACHTSHTHTNHGGSTGGQRCDDCHGALAGMVDDVSTYHHVLDAADPWEAPNGGAYPTTRSDLACVSCHLDHSEYKALPGGSGKAYSMRASATSANPTPANTDDTLCLSCHDQNLARNVTGQKPNAMTETMVWDINVTLWDDSPHNYDSPGPFNDGSIFYANCAKCHGSLVGTLSSGKFSVHFSDEQRLLNALGDTAVYAVNEEQMCFRCHSVAADFAANGGSMPGTPKPSDNVDWYGTQAMSNANVAIYAQMNAGSNTFGHKATSYSGIHLLDEVDENQAYISANMHVECADCHNHHAVGDARHNWGTTNLVSEALQGVTGASFNSAGLASVNFPSTGQVNAQIGWKSVATYEYEICFKCHSSANTNYVAWGAAADIADPGPAIANRWTNVAADFNVGNQSRHPVIAPLNAYPDTVTYGTTNVYAGQLHADWAPGDTMYCSDCHGDSTAPRYSDPDAANHAQGPHGSSVRFSLRGPYTEWPINSRTGLPFTLGNVMAGDKTFCSNCHPNITGNRVHSNNVTHRNSACIRCHTTVPHGGGMSRLMADGDGSMPARFAYQGNKSNVYIASFIKRSDPTSYRRQDCRVTNSVACGSHTAGSATGGSWENW